MPRAIWNGTLIADTQVFENVEGNVYFPADTVRRKHLTESSTTSVCPWKGTAHYYNVVVDGKENRDAAWYYPDPLSAAKNITGHVAFWKGVQIEP